MFALVDICINFLYFSVRVHEPLDVGSLGIKELFSVLPHSSQDWGTSMVLPFSQRPGAPGQAMGDSPKF